MYRILIMYFTNLNIINIIKEINNEIKELSMNSNNFYSKALIKYYKILELFENDKIKFPIFQIDNNYYISENYIKLINMQTNCIIKINNIINKILPNLIQINNIIYNNTKEYNNLDIKIIFQNNEILKIINLKEFNFNDNIFIKLIKSKNFEEDVIKYCGAFNYNQIEYYRYIFKYFLFSINEYNFNLNSINDNIINIIKQNEQLEKENRENRELIDNLTKKIEKIQLILDDYEYI